MIKVLFEIPYKVYECEGGVKERMPAGQAFVEHRPVTVYTVLNVFKKARIPVGIVEVPFEQADITITIQVDEGKEINCRAGLSSDGEFITILADDLLAAVSKWVCLQDILEWVVGASVR